MRRFRVYIAHGCPGDEYIVELPDDATDKQIEEECKLAWDTLVENLDSGWHELTEENGD